MLYPSAEAASFSLNRKVWGSNIKEENAVKTPNIAKIASNAGAKNLETLLNLISP